MNLYLLERKEDADYDEHQGFVIKAASAKEARQIAAARADERDWYTKKDVWLTPSFSTCKLAGNGPAGIVLADFRAG